MWSCRWRGTPSPPSGTPWSPRKCAPCMRGCVTSKIFSHTLKLSVFWIDVALYLVQVWDEADYVVPPAENGAFFVTTNVVITPNQTWGECPEVSGQSKTLLLFCGIHNCELGYVQFLGIYFPEPRLFLKFFLQKPTTLFTSPVTWQFLRKDLLV